MAYKFNDYCFKYAIVLMVKKLNQMDVLPLISLSKTAITAITSKICIIPGALYAKYPTAQPITRIIAIMYNRPFIALYLALNLIII